MERADDDDDEDQDPEEAGIRLVTRTVEVTKERKRERKTGHVRWDDAFVKMYRWMGWHDKEKENGFYARGHDYASTTHKIYFWFKGGSRKSGTQLPSLHVVITRSLI